MLNMPVYLRRNLLAALIAVTIFATAQEPVKPKLNPRIITATRQVTIFTNLEQQMLQMVQKKDKTGLQALLADECAIEMPNADLLAGEDWLDAVTAKDFNLKSFVIRQMSVADLGDSAVVKFDRVQQSTSKGKPDGGEFFVVDLWKKDGDSWKLANRYVAKVSSQLSVSKSPPKPTGKQ
jgi:ketosteroid isomerase-like protein